MSDGNPDPSPPKSGPGSRPASVVDVSSNRGPGSSAGPAVALLFHRALAVVFLIAWTSLASQVLLLIGSRGLLPLADFVAAARAEGALSIATFPSLLGWMPGDGPLLWGTLGGVALSLVSFAGARPRLCAALQTVWYLGYVTACRSFLGFQWDNLLLECGFLATFLPTHRPAPIAHLLLRALLFKLYFESGLAKWQSPLHDWRDGSAMTFYYETAPLPTALAWYAHHLPRGWHVFESYATLAMELVLPFAIFGPRRARLTAAALFTLFQIANAATANYAFFCYLTAALHVFLLDDRDVTILCGWLRALLTPLGRLLRRAAPHVVQNAWASWRRREAPVPATAPPKRPVPRGAAHLGRISAWIGAGAWVFVSLTEAWFHFGDPGAGFAAASLLTVLEWSQTFRIVNTFHLFAAVTRERIEPEIQVQAQAHGHGHAQTEAQTQTDGDWVAYHLRYKPGDPLRAPRFVAPHQPRVDFLLWFYGLAYQRRQPAYAGELLSRLCGDPSAVAPLFRSAPSLPPRAVRIVFWDYRFTSAAEKRVTGAWWKRREIASTQPLVCGYR